jgi:hypothetical protein
MSGMKRLCIAVVALSVWGCGPSYGGQDVKTPDQLVDEQEQLAIQAEKEKKARGDDSSYGGEETDAEKKREFDKKQVKMELQRATRSAESCPGVVAEQEKKDKPRGETRATITFQEDGTVRSVSLPSPFDGTPVGDCVVRAYKSVIVPPYTGGEQIVDWDLTLKDAPKDDEGAKKKK